MKIKSRNFLITSLTMIVMMLAILFSAVAISPLTAFAQGEISVPTIVSVGGIEVDQETTMGGAPSALVGQPYSAQVVATGGDLTYSAGAGEYMNLPEGLTINAETGLISGTCTEETGRYNCLIKATNAMGEASVVIGITVGDSTCVPEIETAAGSLGETYKDSNSQFVVSATNNNASMSIYNFSWSIKSGALPDGMKLTYTSSRTVYITGTPTATGTFNFELEAKNDFGTASRAYSISVVEGSVSPSIVASGESLGYGVVGKPYEYQLEATGTNSNEDPMLWSTDSNDFSQESYDLGNGLSMSKTGLITGTPQTNTQVSFNVYAKNSVGTDSESFYILIYNNGEATTSAITPEVAVVAKGSSKEFTISLEGYGDVEQVAYWSFYMWDAELGSAFPQPTDSELSVNTSTPSKTVMLTVGENETRGQIRVVAYSKPGNGGIKTWATVTIVEKAAVVYNVSFDKNGGDGTMASVPVVENGTYELPTCGFTAPTGYEFKCWSVNDIEKAVGDEITITADTTVKAIWKAKSYTITFDTAGGSAIAPITQAYGSNVVAPSNPTKTGYTFVGWDKQIPETMPAEDITITAEWTVNQYTITFNTNGGSTVSAITQNYGTTIIAPENPTKTGYTFKKWDAVIPATMPAENITITAEWTVNQYTITFNTDGGSEIAPITQDYGTAVVAPANPTKSGYTFTGWDKTIPSTMPAENMTITASWEEILPNTYTVTYTDGVDGVELFADQINANVTEGTATPTFNGTPVREGYTFAGWSPSVASTVTANATYTATWTINQYTITFNTDGGSEIAPITQDYGTMVIAPANPTKSGFTFAGWDKQIPETMPAENMTITASWTPIPVHTHTDADGQWESDGTYHWHTCTCTEIFDKAAHSGGTATCTEKAICSVCNTAYGNTLEHSHGSEWQKNADEHWNECACGDKANKAAHTDENNDGKCDICDYAMGTPENPGENIEPEKTGLSGGAIAGIAVGSVAVVGLGGFSLFWFVIKKKKFADLIALFKKK